MQQYDRRQGPRRGRSAEAETAEQLAAAQERRAAADRRKGKPGLAALLGAIFGSGRPERTD